MGLLTEEDQTWLMKFLSSVDLARFQDRCILIFWFVTVFLLLNFVGLGTLVSCVKSFAVMRWPEAWTKRRGTQKGSGAY
jgi:ABC-type protease/lipase transport system fused ATPase/permease subunit